MMSAIKARIFAFIIFLLFAGMAFQFSLQAKTIGISLLTRKHEFYNYLENGLRKEAAAQNISLIVEAGEYDTVKQDSQVRFFIARKVDAIVLTPCDSRAVGSSIAAANKAGIPVFTVDIANISPLSHVVAHIASDNLDGGRKAAALMVEALKDSGKVVIINHPNVTSVMDRVAGFREVIGAHPRIKILAEIPSWGLRDRAFSIMEDILLKIPDVNGVFAINDNSALGAFDAIKAANKKVVIIGYDAIPEVRKAIDQGTIYGAVIQHPEKIGSITIRTIESYFSGVKVSPMVTVPVGIRTHDAEK
jgi:ribose transport system substrate-binding protein